MYAADNESPYGAPQPFAGPRVTAPSTPAPQTNYLGFKPRKAAPKKAAAPAPRRSARAPAPAAAPSSIGTSPGGTLAPMAPAAPSIEEFLANDSTYKMQQDALQKAMSDYTNNATLSENQYRTQFGSDKDALGVARKQAFSDQENDFAGRGLMNSGLYGQAYSDLETDYNSRQKKLDTGLSDFLANLLSAKNNFGSDQELQRKKAEQDAIARRAATLGL